jgi:hypothetical protein
MVAVGSKFQVQFVLALSASSVWLKSSVCAPVPGALHHYENFLFFTGFFQSLSDRSANTPGVESIPAVPEPEHIGISMTAGHGVDR